MCDEREDIAHVSSGEQSAYIYAKDIRQISTSDFLKGGTRTKNSYYLYVKTVAMLNGNGKRSKCCCSCSCGDFREEKLSDLYFNFSNKRDRDRAEKRLAKSMLIYSHH